VAIFRGKEALRAHLKAKEAGAVQERKQFAAPRRVINLMEALRRSTAEGPDVAGYNEGTANFAFVELEREYGPAPFGRHSACTSC